MMKPNDGENGHWAWYKVNTAANYLKISYHNNNYAIMWEECHSLNIFRNCKNS